MRSFNGLLVFSVLFTLQASANSIKKTLLTYQLADNGVLVELETDKKNPSVRFSYCDDKNNQNACEALGQGWYPVKKIKNYRFRQHLAIAGKAAGGAALLYATYLTFPVANISLVFLVGSAGAFISIINNSRNLHPVPRNLVRNPDMVDVFEHNILWELRRDLREATTDEERKRIEAEMKKVSNDFFQYDYPEAILSILDR
jgi:hypothetical protein